MVPKIKPNPEFSMIFRTMFSKMKEMLVPGAILKMEDHPLSAASDGFFSTARSLKMFNFKENYAAFTCRVHRPY